MSEKDNHSLKLILIVLLWLFAFYVALNITRDSEPLESSSRPIAPKHRGVCKSPECITLAHQLHNFRDVSVDPCQDFYKAVCGKYSEHTLGNIARYSRVHNIAQQLVQEFLETSELSDSISENSMKLYYKQCRGLQKMKNRTKLLEQHLKMAQKVGSAPIFDKNWDESDFDLNDVLSRMAENGALDFGLFNFKTENIVGVLIRPSSESLRVIGSLMEFFVNLTKMNGINEEMARKDLEDVAKLMTEISKLNYTNTEPIELSKLQNEVPIVDFERILKSYLTRKLDEESWGKVKNMTGTLSMPYFVDPVENIQLLIQKSPKRTLANFLILNFMLSTFDTTEKIPAYSMLNSCGANVYSNFPLAALRVYVRNHYNKENLKVASGIIEEIRKGYTEMFQDAKWLHEKTKENAILKVEKMKKFIGYPEEFEAPGALDKFYETLKLSETDTWVETRMKVEKFNMQLHIEFVAEILPMKPEASFASANAYYTQDNNRFHMLVLYIDDPVFDSSYPQYVKVAGIGGTIGHEMGHGFDTGGRLMDENGEEKDWWSLEDSKEYHKRAQCLVEQYDNYDDPTYGRNLDGSLTLDEMISDLIGIKASLKAYNKVDFSNEPKIFGFEDEPLDKLFFHLTALNWCSPEPNYSLAQQQTLRHPTSSFRVNGVFSNIKEFSEAFNCPVGSPMNPEKKCELF